MSPESRKLIVALSAMFGKAAVAESRGDVAAAKKSLEDVAAAAAHEYPPLAKLADARPLPRWAERGGGPPIEGRPAHAGPDVADRSAGRR
ncbi:MAG: hypothetical protein U0575_16760 [Phycisphaerales bacterium]